DLMYHINTEDKPFTARKENGVFIVEGKLIEQLLASVNLDDNDSIKYFQKVLRKRGIVDELRQLGVKDGDTIRMLDLEFEYFE
ncbi:MAG TPA: Obg family GTPase CgtA, partial [Clostridia bacterium]|nr:Obg family GTPase CgtA [Clostridia bacterium]